MDIEFIGQPINAQIGIRLKNLLAQPSTRSFRALTAWGKLSGLRRLGGSMQAAMNRGVDVEVIVGVDEGGATTEGLHALLELTSRCFVFHNPGRPKRTFHPKIYVVEAQELTTAIVGSGNLTSGGMYGNYEAASLVRIPNTMDSGSPVAKYLIDLLSYYDTFRNDKNSCRQLSAEFLEKLTQDKSLIIDSERRRRTKDHPSETNAASEARTFQPSTIDLFLPPKPTFELAWLPDDQGEIDADADDDSDDLVTQVHQRSATSQTTNIAVTPPDAAAKFTDTRKFYKQLSKFDVHLTSAPGQIIIPIEFLDFFGELQEEKDGTLTGGSSQWATTIPGRFKKGSIDMQFEEGRVIVYKPASSHARPNTEVRFTFHNKEIMRLLNAGDYLIFEWNGDQLLVTRSLAAPGSNKFGWV